jgi:hypothetical protein
MSVLHGGDSATPKPDKYEGKKIWGVYVAGATPHVWTHEEVLELKSHGIEGVLPIVVPPQNEDWWLDNYGYATLEALVREAVKWGLPEGSPICLDVEEHQSEKISAPSDVLHCWAVACAVHKFRGWVYGNESFLRKDMWAQRWYADWPEPTPENPELLEGFAGWQYAGNTDGIDLDVFKEGLYYLSPELKVVQIPAPATTSGDAPHDTPVADSTEPTPVTEGGEAAGYVGSPAAPADVAPEPELIGGDTPGAEGTAESAEPVTPSTTATPPEAVSAPSREERLQSIFDELKSLLGIGEPA